MSGNAIHPSSKTKNPKRKWKWRRMINDDTWCSGLALCPLTFLGKLWYAVRKKDPCLWVSLWLKQGWIWSRDKNRFLVLLNRRAWISIGGNKETHLVQSQLSGSGSERKRATVIKCLLWIQLVSLRRGLIVAQWQGPGTMTSEALMMPLCTYPACALPLWWSVSEDYTCHGTFLF